MAFFYLAIRSKKKMWKTCVPNLKPNSFEPESNQRPKDSQHFIYSPPLYQLSYRRMENLTPQQHTKKFRNPYLLRSLREIRLLFVVNASRALHRKHHLLLRPRGATVACLTPNQKVACSNHIGVRRSLLDIKRVMSNMGNVPSVT